MYLNGPKTGFDAWFNWGSFITNVTTTPAPAPAPPPPPGDTPPDVNISGFLLKPNLLSVGTQLSVVNCTAGGGAACVRQAAAACAARSDCGGVSFSPAWQPASAPAARLFSGGDGSTMPQECGNTEWNWWCKPGHCGKPCDDDHGPAATLGEHDSNLSPGRRAAVLSLAAFTPRRCVSGLGEGAWHAAVTPNAVSISMMYAENVKEELTAPGEWFLDVAEQKLYLYPNGTLDEKTELVASTLTSLIDIHGTREQPVRGVTLSGLTLTGTRSTFMERYSIVSSGDWAIYRGASIKASRTEALTVRPRPTAKPRLGEQVKEPLFCWRRWSSARSRASAATASF